MPESTLGSTFQSLHTPIIATILSQGSYKESLGIMRKDCTTVWDDVAPFFMKSRSS